MFTDFLAMLWFARDMLPTIASDSRLWTVWMDLAIVCVTTETMQPKFYKQGFMNRVYYTARPFVDGRIVITNPMC
jgi:hypothetical protein